MEETNIVAHSVRVGLRFDRYVGCASYKSNFRSKFCNAVFQGIRTLVSDSFVINLHK
jgi:hypothetical protein